MRFIDWLMPQNFKTLLKRMFKKTTINDDVLISENTQFNNIVKNNRTCYILATGPSIKEMDLSPLVDKDCISVSNFFVHNLYTTIKPKYHLFAPWHEPITDEQYSAWIMDYAKNTTFQQTLCLGINEKRFLESSNLPINEFNIFYRLSDQMPETFETITLDKSLPKIQTVVHIAIYHAIALGYKDICLLGIDHNWLLNIGKSNHFYEEKQHEFVRRGYSEWGETDMEYQLAANLRLWQVYKSIRKYSEKNGINIYNCTPNSLLDVFPKKQLTEVI